MYFALTLAGLATGVKLGSDIAVMGQDEVEDNSACRLVPCAWKYHMILDFRLLFLHSHRDASALASGLPGI